MKPTINNTIRVWLVEDNVIFAEGVQWVVDS
jgi:hypothetical protein